MSVDELLTPVSPDQPCGEDISYDPELQELEKALQGKPETQFSDAEEPNWNDIEARATALFARSKNLRVAMALVLASLQRKGFSGFRDGLHLLRELIERHWEDLYPRLDPEDNNDPIERINILSSLVTRVGTFGDPMRFLERLRRTPLTKSTQFGKFNLADVEAAHSRTPPEGAPTITEIEGAIKDTPDEELMDVFQAVQETFEETRRIDRVLTETIGANRSLDWSPLQAVLQEIQKVITPHLPQKALEEPVVALPPEEEPVAEAKPKAAAMTGEISSRDDVLRYIDRICDYYKRYEPSSPVPYLLLRARAMVNMNYMEIVQHMTPDALAQAQLITGQPPEAED
jgi:type VI secretion system protein ImpA